ncbi:LLM class flavin-dependent oxidoreductase [Actinocatenispora rupis]|uniref:Alkanal monooxygenase n=1 Tax=Actinocatenispora rupis TaxID=519421 RepID=A0A8J3NAL6_9ACTN|nr:LLM class flavin-dependent oxidoreductase [Actinocatenispora rupis]GID09697.1 alkanal monooxygenase [Actinocatenispora rupis]
MTAEPRTGARGGRITAPRTTRIDAFLLAAPTSGGTTADAVRRAVEYGVAAEAAGFDGAWFAEHHFVTYGCCPSAPALAAHLLGRTERITVGTAACVLSARHPVALAEEAVLLDAVSGGRFALGVARGGPWVDLEVFGTGLDRYRTGFAESLDLMTGWLSGVDSLGAAGRHFAFRPVSVVPQPEHPVPVYVAATSPSTVECAAARGLPLLLGMHATDAEKRALLDRYAAVAERHGYDPDVDHAAAFLAYQADTRAEAHRRLRAAMPARLAATTGYVRIDGSAPPITDHAAYLARLLATQPVGTAADVTERLAESVAATGIRRALLMVEGAGDPAATRETIAALGATLSR